MSDEWIGFWIDVLKLSVPLATGVALVYGREAILRHRQIRLRREALWKILTKRDNLSKLKAAIRELDLIAQAIFNSRVRLVSLHVPLAPLDQAKHLTALDPCNSDIYSTYVARAAVVECDIETLQYLCRNYYISSAPSDRLRQAAINQTVSLQRDLVGLGEASVCILEHLAEVLSKSSEEIDAMKQDMQTAKSRVQSSKLVVVTDISDFQENGYQEARSVDLD